MITSIRKKFRGKFLWIKNPITSAYRRLAGPEYQFVDWQSILTKDSRQWRGALSASKHGPQVLIGTTLGAGLKVWPSVETMLAVALTLRGARVHILLCDRHLPACMPWVFSDLDERADLSQHGPNGKTCESCFPPVWNSFRALSLPIHRYSELTTGSDLTEAARVSSSVPLEEMGNFTWQGIAVGEHAIAGTIRFFGAANLQDGRNTEVAARRYLEAAMITTSAVQRLLGAFDFTVACGSHGIYVPQGLVGEVMRKRGGRVVNWMPAYREGCLIFSEGNTYHKTLLDEPVSAWENMPWDQRLDVQIMDYLESRQYGARDWISFNRNPDEESLDGLKRMGVNFNIPSIGLLTNVAWDAQLHYGPTPFRDMMEWVCQTVAYFAQRPDLQLIIRVHPAEIKGFVKSRQPVAEEIRKAFPELPDNIFVIPPESTISTYDAMEQCNAVIIYATKTGIELTARGIPVIVVGEAWIKNKGFALDVGTKEDYFTVLDSLPLPHRLSPESTRRARMYAYHFFMRRMIPVSWFDSKFQLRIQQLSDLLPGRSPGVDVICEGILEGKNGFIYPAEEYSSLRPV